MVTGFHRKFYTPEYVRLNPKMNISGQQYTPHDVSVFETQWASFFEHWFGAHVNVCH
jgi:hypothetical protein